MASLDFLTQITLLLLFGLLMGILAKRLKIPSMLLLIISGGILSRITIDGQQLFALSNEFLLGASLLALVMIVFEGSSNFLLGDLDTYSQGAAKISIVFLAFNMLLLAVATYFLFNMNSLILSMLFAAVMSGTDPASVLSMFHTKSNKIIEILKYESVINTPLIVLIPFILLDILELDVAVIQNFIEYIGPFLQQIITGIGTGVVVGLIVFRIMRKFYSDRFSPITLITAALLAYNLAENLGGNGVLSTTVLGIFFGNVSLKKKVELKSFSSTLSNILETLVFILIGFLIPNITFAFFIKSLILFAIMIGIRFLSIYIVYMNEKIHIKEQIFMALNASKGIAVAVIALILTKYVLQMQIIENGIHTIKEVPFTEILGANVIINLMVLFIVYSVVLSSFAARNSQKFIRLKVEG